MSQKLGRRARRIKSQLGQKAPPEWSVLGARSAYELMAFMGIALLYACVSILPYALDVFDNTRDFVLVFLIVWVAMFFSYMYVDHPDKTTGDAKRTACGAFGGLCICLVAGSSAEGVAIGTAIGGGYAFAIPYWPAGLG